MANSKLTIRTSQCGYVINFKNEMQIEKMHSFFNFVTENGGKYAYIIHDKDFNENGEAKTIHAHIFVEFAKSHQLQWYLYRFEDCTGFDANQISVKDVLSLPYSIQYLTHKNDPQKTQYSVLNVITNYSKDVFEELYNKECEEMLTFEKLLRVLEHSITLTEVASTIGLKEFKENYQLIRIMKEEGHLNKANRRCEDNKELPF